MNSEDLHKSGLVELIGNRFWPSGALAGSLKPKACVSMGAQSDEVGPEVKHGLFRVAGRVRNPKKLPPEGLGAAEQGGARGALGRCRTFPLLPNTRESRSRRSHRSPD
jgi:hypothetical protein